MGTAYDGLNDYRKALEYNQKSLEINRRINNPLGEANSLMDIGSTLTKLKEYQGALTYFHKALEIFKRINNVLGEAGVLLNIGITQSVLENYEIALEFLKQAKEKYVNLEMEREIQEVDIIIEKIRTGSK